MKKAKDNSLMGIELYSCTNKVVLKEILAQTLACLDIVCRVLKRIEKIGQMEDKRSSRS